MPRITPVSAKKRKLEEATRGRTSRPRKQFKKQKHYHSSSEDGSEENFAPVDLAGSDEERVPARARSIKLGVTASDAPKIVKERRVKPHAEIPATKVEEDVESSGDEEDNVNVQPLAALKGDVDSIDGSDDESGSGSDSDSSSNAGTGANSRKKSKRNDPEAFSTSISKILSTKLPTSVRADPLLSRSKEAAQKATDTNTAKLDRKALGRLRAEKLTAMSKGRVTDVLGIERGIAGEIAEEEKQLRKIAQRGVIQLFNAFQAAHVRAEQARREERQKGTVGMGNREEKAQEDGKEAFLQMIGGKKKVDSMT